MPQLKVQDDDEAIACRPRQTMLAAALDADRDWPYGCRVGMCGRCRCRVISGKTTALGTYEPVLGPEDVANGEVLACRTLLLGDVEVSREHLERHAAVVAEATPARVLGIEPVTPLVSRLTVAFDDADAAPVWTAGQYTQLMTAGMANGRSFSFATACRGDGEAEFLIRHFVDGEFSSWMINSAKPGETLGVSPPQGHYDIGQSSEPLLCFAGGSGVAPILSILEEIVAGAVEPRQVRVIVAARDFEHVVDRDRFERLRQQWPIGPDGYELDVQLVLSRQSPDPVRPDGARFGYVFDHLDDLIAGFSKATTLLAGPPGLVEAIELALRSQGFSPDQIILDRFLPGWTER